MNGNVSVLTYVASGDTSALPTVSDSCEASVGKVCRRCVSDTYVDKKRQTFKPAFIKYYLRDDYIFLKATQPLCPPNPSESEIAIVRSASTGIHGV